MYGTAASMPVDRGERTGDLAGDDAAPAPIAEDGDPGIGARGAGAACGDTGGVAEKLLKQYEHYWMREDWCSA